jgi:3'(2'), 5'-bisphosphate nucleotidase
MSDRILTAEEPPIVPRLDPTACAEMMGELTKISERAAETIMHLGLQGTRVKADGSPVTAADEAAEAVICDALARLYPELPVISEEQAERDRPSVEAGSYLLVDPLDGTREFVAGRDEYTINIAVMTDGVPALGVITAPALGLIWRGVVGRGAERMTMGKLSNGQPDAIRSRPRPAGEFIAAVSRSHLEARTRAYLDRLPEAKLVAFGSALKFCRLAEGTADLYPRLAPTRDWDVAAGHAIVAAAGGSVVAPDGAPLAYGTAELLIPGFLAWGDASRNYGFITD